MGHDDSKPPPGDGRSSESGLPPLFEDAEGDTGRDVTAVFRPTLAPGHPADVTAPALELTVVKRRGVSHTDDDAEWVALEIWTRHRIYLVSATMRCIGVFNRLNARQEPSHTLVGALLSGGQRQHDDGVELSQPYPLPGMRAVFRYKVGSREVPRFATTSEIERVVLRLGVTCIEKTAPGEGWRAATTRFFRPVWKE